MACLSNTASNSKLTTTNMTTNVIALETEHQLCTSLEECQDHGHILGECAECHQPVFVWEISIPMPLSLSIFIHAEHLAPKPSVA